MDFWRSNNPLGKHETLVWGWCAWYHQPQMMHASYKWLWPTSSKTGLILIKAELLKRRHNRKHSVHPRCSKILKILNFSFIWCHCHNKLIEFSSIHSYYKIKKEKKIAKIRLQYLLGHHPCYLTSCWVISSNFMDAWLIQTLIHVYCWVNDKNKTKKWVLQKFLDHLEFKSSPKMGVLKVSQDLIFIF